MDNATRIKITDKLRTFLNREPSEGEIQNGQTDVRLQTWITQDDVQAQQTTVDKLQGNQNLTV